MSDKKKGGHFVQRVGRERLRRLMFTVGNGWEGNIVG